MRVHRFAGICSTGVQFAQAFRQPYFDAPREGIDARADFGRQRDEQLACWGGHQQRPGFRQAGAAVLFAGALHILNYAQRRRAAFLPHFATDEIADVIAPRGEWFAFGERDLNLEPTQGFGFRDGLRALEAKNRLPQMNAAGNDPGASRSAAPIRQPSVAQPGEPLREIRQDFSGYLTPAAPRAQDARKGYRSKRF